MGTDIHNCIQVFEDGIWKEIQWQRALYEFQIDRGEKPLPDIPVAPHHFTGRNYDTFGILANVRNGRGFAGVEMGEGWIPIAPERGFPEGFDPDLIFAEPRYADEGPRYMGDHDHTWLTLDELKEYPWKTNSSRLYGVIPAKAYEERKRDGKENEPPEAYSGGVGGPGVTTYTPDEWEAYKKAHPEALAEVMAAKGGPMNFGHTRYVRIAWGETASSATNGYDEKVIPWLEELAAGRPLRLVLGFDS